MAPYQTSEQDKTDTIIFIILIFFLFICYFLARRLMQIYPELLSSWIGRLPQTWHNAVILLIK